MDCRRESIPHPNGENNDEPSKAYISRSNADEASAKPKKVEVSTETVSGVRICNYETFMNDYDPQAPRGAIEVLVAGSCLNQEISVEARKRYFDKIEGYKDEPAEHIVRAADPDSMIHYIRIRSTTLLRVFSKVTGYNWGSRPRTFSQPFRAMVHYHDKFVDEIQSSSADSNSMEDLRCYVEFIEANLLPRTKVFRSPNSSTAVEVRFSDLWYLFKPGDLVYIPGEAVRKATETRIRRIGFEQEDELDFGSSIRQRIWKFHCFRRLRAPKSDDEILYAQCYYLDYNGISYGAVSVQFELSTFEGAKDVRELDLYPLAFSPDSHQLLEEAKRVGQLFTRYVEIRHLSCTGTSITTSAVGVPLMERMYAGDRPAPVRIDGEIIVDFKETFDNKPVFSQKFTEYNLSTSTRATAVFSELEDRFLHWADADRSKLVASTLETIFTSIDIEEVERDSALEHEPYLRRSQDPRPAPTGDDLALLPPRLFVFALSVRQFHAVHVRDIKELEWIQDPFSELELPARDKLDVRAAVHAHHRKREMQRLLEQRHTGHIRHQDIIQSKGNGLLIMLHGEPGVGKTATAEAIAQSTRRPLLSVPCATLTDSRGDLSEHLRFIFHIAELWGCILLFDEADVFLNARSSANSSLANAIITTFLQQVEYFNGILFLTTNRTGKLDQALSSRIHLMLHYRRLGTERTLKLFLLNIRRLRQVEEQQDEVSDDRPLFIVESEVMRFAEEHCRKHPTGKGAWNGRQIRNAFTMAAAYARYEALEIGDKKFQPQLRYSHFQRVEAMITEYNQLRTHLLGGDDTRKARLNEERDDDFGGDEDDADPGHDKAKPSAPSFLQPRSPATTISRPDSSYGMLPVGLPIGIPPYQPQPLRAQTQSISSVPVYAPSVTTEYTQAPSSQGYNCQAMQDWNQRPTTMRLPIHNQTFQGHRLNSPLHLNNVSGDSASHLHSQRAVDAQTFRG